MGRSSPRPGAVPPPPAQERGFPVSFVADEELGDEVKAHALEVLLDVASHAPRPVLHARMTLRLHPDPALERPAVAKASLDVGGRPVRAHVAAEQMREAIDLLERRLRRNLESLEELRRARRRKRAAVPPGEWRHGNQPAERPAYFPRPPEERELVRRKTFAPSELTPEEAALELQLLDHDFHLFTNAETGEEDVVHRRADGTIGIERGPAPAMLLEEATERLDLSGDPFVFFTDPQTRRGQLLYVRYDGHYGLIEPDPAPSPAAG